MKPEIAEMWIEALESGEYKQTSEVLTRIYNGEQRHCCLGVLCKLAIKNGLQIDTRLEEDLLGYPITYYDDEHNYLPAKVRDWAGMNNTRGVYAKGESLALDNDSAKTFLEIAQIIKDNKEVL